MTAFDRPENRVPLVRRGSGRRDQCDGANTQSLQRRTDRAAQRSRGPVPPTLELGSALIVLAACVVALASGVQPTSPPPDSPSELTGQAPEPLADSPIPSQLHPRLETLSPADPRAYFLLGEEVAAMATTPDLTTLARTLYVLAFELDRRRQAAGAAADPGLAASACLALADLSSLEEDRRWLVALARSIDRRYASPDWSRAAQPTYSGQAALRAAEFLGLVRSGDGHRARDLLRDPEVDQVLHDFERMIGGLGSSGMLREMELQSRQWPCVQCGNARITRLGETSPPRRGICPTCNGNPGPELSRSDLVNQLRFESGLLNGIQSSWSAQLTLDMGAPLREPSPAELAPVMRINPDAVYWREGLWVETPSGQPRPRPAPTPPPVQPEPEEEPGPPSPPPETTGGQG
jgi:hypothetical protein